MAVELRDAAESDLALILAIYNDAVINTTAVYDYQPRTMAAQQQWFAAKRADNLPVVVAVQDGVVAGFASYGRFRPWPAYLHSVEHSLYVAPDRRGRGLGSRLLPALIERARGQTLHTMIAGIDASNAASLRLHEKHGFERVGHVREVGWKFERWLDLVFMQRLLDAG